MFRAFGTRVTVSELNYESMNETFALSVPGDDLVPLSLCMKVIGRRQIVRRAKL
ncbi:hypothetical protein BDV96DRAFT_581898, partial [Lophiotrema nucula]